MSVTNTLKDHPNSYLLATRDNHPCVDKAIGSSEGLPLEVCDVVCIVCRGTIKVFGGAASEFNIIPVSLSCNNEESFGGNQGYGLV